MAHKRCTHVGAPWQEREGQRAATCQEGTHRSPYSRSIRWYLVQASGLELLVERFEVEMLRFRGQGAGFSLFRVQGLVSLSVPVLQIHPVVSGVGFRAQGLGPGLWD